MSDDSITVKVLAELRDDVRELRTEVRTTNERLVQTNERIDQTNERMERMRLELKGDLKTELSGVETRIATRQIEHTAATRDLYDMIQDRLQLRDRVELLESVVANLKDRVG